MRSSSPLVALAMAVVLAATGCATAQVGDGSPFDGSRGAGDVLLTVENNDFYDATIHLYWNGVRTRAGMVTGKTTETFRLPWRSEWAYIEVDFIGGGDDYQSERVPVYPGDHLNFVIMVGLSNR
ncbi:MAG TPA: hypothetical protein VMM35_10210 [Longimicrobiales bacterium]|nr:hypothetical protein [Longimicrobiales bacterium]